MLDIPLAVTAISGGALVFATVFTYAISGPVAALIRKITQR